MQGTYRTACGVGRVDAAGWRAVLAHLVLLGAVGTDIGATLAAEALRAGCSIPALPGFDYTIFRVVAFAKPFAALPTTQFCRPSSGRENEIE